MCKIATAVLAIFALVGIANAQEIDKKQSLPEALSVETSPTAPTTESRLIDAVNAFQEENYSKASMELNKLYTADPNNDAVLYYLALCEFAAGRGERAETLMRRALEIDSENVWYREKLSYILIQNQKYEDAAEQIELLLDKLPSQFNNPFMLSFVAEMRLYRDFPATASEYYSRALALDPSYAPAQEGLAKAEYIRGNYPSFFKALDSYALNMTAEPEAKVKLILSLLSKLDSNFYWTWGKKVNQVIDTVASVHPHSYEAMELKMQMRYFEKDVEGVIECTNKLLEIALANNDMVRAAKALTTQADLCYESGEIKKSERLYKKAIKYDPACATALNNYAYHLSESGKQLRKALKLSARAIELEPDNASYLDTYGWLLHQLGNDQEAKSYLKRSIIHGGVESKVMLEHYATVLDALGEHERAQYYKDLSEKKK